MADELTETKPPKFELATIPGWTPRITPEQLENIGQYFQIHATGVSSYSPLRCTGPNCSWYRECPLVKNDIDLPIDNYCPVELTLINSWVRDMAAELKLEPNSIFDLFSIGAIAINQIMTKRALKVLSEEDFIIEHFRAMTPDGQAIFERRVHPALNAVKEMTKSSQQIQSDLMATRKEKSKGEARTRMSPSEQLKKLQDKMKQVQVTVQDGQNELMKHYGDLNRVIEADFVVVEKNERDGSIKYRKAEGVPVSGDPGAPVDPAGDAPADEPGPRAEEAQPDSGSGAPGPTPDGDGKECRPKRDPRTGFLIDE